MATSRLTHRQVGGIVFFVQFAIFLTISRYRLVDGDEGFYLMTARLVAEHQLPYHDFLLTQMPLVPYLYGWWMRVAGMNWMSARLLSAILTTLLGTALYAEVSRQTGRKAAGVAAALLFVSTTHVFAWFPIVKTFALSTLLLFLAYRAILRGSTGALAAAGLLLGASADARLYFAGLLPVFLWWIYRYSRNVRAFAAFLGGFALAVAPNLYLLARDPEAFYFGNLGFHAIRSPEGFIGGFSGKAVVAAMLFLTDGDNNGAQMSLLGLAVLLLAVRRGLKIGAARLALVLALVLGLISFLPTPAFVQYFSVTIPFVIVFVVCALDRVLEKLVDRRRIYLRTACACLLLLFMACGIPDLTRFLNTGEGVIGVGNQEHANDWRIATIAAVSRAIDAHSYPGEPVMSLWPGYVFASHAEPVDGLQNNSATFLGERLTPEQQARYHVSSTARILTDISAGVPGLVVLGNQESMLVSGAPFEDRLRHSGYHIAATIGRATVWQLHQ